MRRVNRYRTKVDFDATSISKYNKYKNFIEKNPNEWSQRLLAFAEGTVFFGKISEKKYKKHLDKFNDAASKLEQTGVLYKKNIRC